MSDFNIAKPTAQPTSAVAGPIRLDFFVQPQVTGNYTFRVAIYEGSWLPGRGDWMQSIDKQVYFVAGVTKEVNVYFTSVASSEPRRDVRVNILTLFHPDSGQLVADQEWDDVYHVTNGPDGPPPDDEPPPNVTFDGRITSVELQEEVYSGSRAKFLLSWIASAHNWWDGFGGWETRITMTTGAGSDSDRQNHNGSNGGRNNQALDLGVLPVGSHPTIVTLEAKGLIGQWQLLDEKEVTIQVLSPDEPPPDEEPPGEASKIPWGGIVIAGGLGLLGLSILPKDLTKRK